MDFGVGVFVFRLKSWSHAHARVYGIGPRHDKVCLLLPLI